ncbi:1-deoxy-D-xylulose-5-phosphate reductoisomerase [Clostridium algidicarnis]|uniref:1-deoxy-D-xylulose 5-phosphate reductoisomerase n=2 Tax=Clostridium algidicarnis TaxID=37659 RepID=A0A2S6FXX7_9CLOT|nr:1-deoxy-D-xylulose-5-phosphate reductoisomerase [Clostridium algidicarnis]MBB6630202.1 1-deoxy-D-xylulose-5-phosphate reductoisomerase [Clostridium algidicarnis]MBB6697490.1 1-deoxy-D-xylulose-5-phosphate reductoisomerase [Clostridium algidicarnis]MBU3192977.1 1-deoxy-D-xylulose-5-phosphate reductoisomerase [Clostridium algidicarnis]MBU3203421.1 1-deoxy-D-xylulose-5-phosphate reductoisomerase [Clostridium algidicarnis]MBU3211575.1 1-deoxy-D-xylulose-5-phosphate reductoisomerase [Clostridium
MKNITIIGATGSIGMQTLDVIKKDRDNFNLVAVSLNKSYEKAIEIIEEFQPKYMVVNDYETYKAINQFVDKEKKKTLLLNDIEGLNYIASLDEIDTVVTSIVGMIGLEPTLKAIRSGKNIALANKETLVVAGDLIMEEARINNVSILPVDSEHSAIFQCIQGNKENRINKIILTASGGPFRGKSIEDLKKVTLEEALNHPNWKMGSKITIDSATLMNKGLEVIEAHHLFNVDYEDINVVVHPQSIIHSGVEFKDRSVITQMGNPDMRLPIQYALNYPKRKEAVVDTLDFFSLKPLTFEKPDMNTFRCLSLAFEAGKMGGIMPTILNAANEVCVSLFISKKINFLEIPVIIEECMRKFNFNVELNLKNIKDADKEVRSYINLKYN